MELLENVLPRIAKMSSLLDHLPYEERQRAETVQLRETKAQRELINIYKYLKGMEELPEGAKGQNQDLLHGAQWQDRSWWAQLEMQDVPSEHQKTHFSCEADQALAQFAQRGGGISFLEEIQDLSGHGPEQLL